MSRTGLVFDIKRFAVHDGPGIRTTVFLKGCGLQCKWCHNPESISRQPQLAYYADKCINCSECVSVCPYSAHQIVASKHLFDRDKCKLCNECEAVCLGDALKIYGKQMSVDEVLSIVLEDCVFFDQSGGGVTLSGGEPLVQSGFCYELLVEFKKHGLHTTVDTCGNVSWSDFEKVLSVTDMFLYDIKHIYEKPHIANTGASNKKILANLNKLSQCGKPIEIRIPLIPGFNMDQESAKAFGEILGSLSNISAVKLLAYHDFARSKYKALGLANTMPRVDLPSQSQIEEIADCLRKFNLVVK
ncbi:MAG: glycyl-radical enzyme activating protein [Sedimentisphaeraceae bacterium JB056]